jgi:hypothetical protein
MRHASLDVPHRAVSVFLLQLALSLFGQIEVFLDNLGRFIGEILYVGVTPILCLCLKFGKVFFVVLDHHIHVGFIRAPFLSWLFGRQFNAFLLSDRFQPIVGFAVISDHSFAE